MRSKYAILLCKYKIMLMIMIMIEYTSDPLLYQEILNSIYISSSNLSL